MFLIEQINDTIPVFHSQIDLFNDYLLELDKNERIKSSEAYTTTKNYLIGFIKKTLGGKSLKDFEQTNHFPLLGITSHFLRNFERHLERNGLSQSSIGIYTRNIRSIYNRAIRDRLIGRETYPFGATGYTPPAARKAKKALTLTDKIFQQTR